MRSAFSRSGALEGVARTGLMAVWLAWGSSASAATITVMSPGFVGGVHPGPPVVTSTGPIPDTILFDPALGTLEAVEIFYNGEASVRKTLDVEPGDYAFIRVQVRDPSSGFTAEGGAPLAASVAPVTESGPFTFGEGNAKMLWVVATENLDVFITGGTLEATITGLILVAPLGPGGPVYDGQADTLGGASVLGQMVRYTYTPVPEPNAGLVFAMGFAILAARLSRRA